MVKGFYVFAYVERGREREKRETGRGCWEAGERERDKETDRQIDRYVC